MTLLPANATSGTFVFVPDHHGFYDDLVTMLVSLSSYMFSMHAWLSSNNSTPFEQRSREELISYIAPIRTLEFPLSLENHADNSKIVFFPAEILMYMALDSWPQFLEYKLEAKQTSSPARRLVKEGNRRALSRIVGASFTSYYSNSEATLRARYGTTPDKWPEPVRFAWAIRNGFAHGGRLKISDPKLRPVVWKIWSFDNKNDGQPFLFETGMLGIGDIISLMTDFDTYVFP